ncbi:MAG TPA: type VII secretion protein EccCb [Candidatus Dormibacteraeota bacterium]
MQVVVRRPARLPPPQVPDDEVLVASPPRLDSAQAGVVGWLQYLVPVIGSLGAVLFVVVNPKPIYIVSGVLFALAAVAMGVGMGAQQQLGARRRTALERGRYQVYLAGLRRAARGVTEQQRAAAAWRHPAPGGLQQVVRSEVRRWERRQDDADFLELRVGEGRRPLATPLRLEGGGGPLNRTDPVAEQALRSFVSAQGTVSDQPLTVRLTEAPVLSVVGARQPALSLLRALLGQLVALHAPDDARLMLCLGERERGDWQWTKWLPHLRTSGVAGEGSAIRVGGAPDLAAAIATEAALAGARTSPGEPAPARPWLVILADGVMPPPEALELLRLRGGGRVTVVTLAETQQSEPSAVDVRLRLDGDGGLSVERADEEKPVAQGRADGLGVHAAEALARRLAPLRLSPESSGRRRLMETIPLAELLGIPDLASLKPAELWRPRPLPERLRLPIGVSSEGEPVLLDLKEAALGGDGPHGLVIGATGSGKSELLRTVVTGLALSHPPDLLAFVLVDFKGGAAFAGLNELPHVAGMITNLADDLALVDRMHAALFGEMRRRQELLKQAGNLASVRDYHRRRSAGAPLQPLPYLLLIVDEFGELLASRPDFIDLFVAVGRLGRSLGMHLLLSSQQLEEGRLRGLEGHLSYRVALRTFSAQESRSVLGVPDAYELPPVPGSGYLKVGTRVYTRFRAALVSQPYAQRREEAPAAPRLEPFTLQGPRAGEAAAAEPRAAEEEAGGRSMLETAVVQLREAAPRVHQVWLPPLEPALTLDSVIGELRSRPGPGLLGPDTPWSGSLAVPLGLVDRPAEQARGVLSVDLSGAGGHLLLVGGPQTGKSTLLRTLICAFSLTHTPLEAQFYCVDYGGGALASLEALPQVGGVCGRHDPERVRRTVSEMTALLDERERRFRELGIDSPAAMRARRGTGQTGAGPTGGERLADVFLVIDNWPAVKQDFEELEPQLQDIAARGLGYGVHLVLSANRWIDIRSSLREAIGGRLELRLHDPSESAIDRTAAANLAAGLPGRGLTRPAFHFQAALPRLDGRPSTADLAPAVEQLVAGVAGAWRGPAAPPVRVLPRVLHAGELPLPGGDLEPGVPVGVSERDLCPVYLDLASGDPHLIVFGDGESGKTNLLRTFLGGLLARSTAGQAQVLVVDYRRTLLGVVPPEHLLGYAGTDPAAVQQVAETVQALSRRLPSADLSVEQLRNRSWWQGPEAYVVIDDYDLVATPAGDPLAPLLPLLPQARDVGLHVVVTHRVGGAARALYQASLLLRLRELGSPGILLGGDPQEGVLLAGQRATAQPPGRGLLVRRRDRPSLVQVALSGAAG